MNRVTRICLIADFRSPHAINWLQALGSTNRYEVHAISTYSCDPPAGVTSFAVVPLDHPRLRAMLTRSPFVKAVVHFVRNVLIRTDSIELRHLGIEKDIFRKARIVRSELAKIEPDIVHALRIPFEGVLAADAVPTSSVLILSVWGNDFTLFGSTPSLRNVVARAVQRANALHADTERDIKLATDFGFRLEKPYITLPAGGGIDTDLFAKGSFSDGLARELSIAVGSPVIINPRGIRSYVRTENFIRAAAVVLKAFPNVVFILSATEGSIQIKNLVKSLRIEHAVRSTPLVPYGSLPNYYRLAKIMVSPSTHDGTPSTLLESMACGCFPIAGDLDSIREWIQHGENGLLCDPDSVESIASAMLAALQQPDLVSHAAAINQDIIAKRASRAAIKSQIVDFYARAIENRHAPNNFMSS